jgi:hypothetical protein
MRLGLQKWVAWEEEISLLLPYMIEALPRLIISYLSLLTSPDLLIYISCCLMILISSV